MGEKKKALCILNPATGKPGALPEVQNLVTRHIGEEHDVAFYFTSARGDAMRAAQTADPDTALLVCCGGDGTLSETINGMWRGKKQFPVFLIPRGTTNDVAKTIRVPASPHACMALLSGRPVLMDAGCFNSDTCFTYIAAFGAFTEFSYSTSQSAKNKFGHLAYLANFFKGLVRVRSKELTAHVDGKKISGRFLFGSVTNSLSIAGILKLTGHGVSTRDGLLELLLVERPKNILIMPYVALKLLLRKYNTKWIQLHQCREVTFSFARDTAWTVDGEYGGSVNRAEIKVLPELYSIYGSPQ